MKNVFDFQDYSSFLLDRAGPDRQRLGVKSAMATAIGCQPTYMTQILKGRAHLSLEQAERLNTFFGHGRDESHYFLLLVQKDRAGTVALKNYFDEQIKAVESKRKVLTERLGKKNILSKEDQLIYYSSWAYAAVHIATGIPALQTKKALMNAFKLPPGKIEEILHFLVSTRLVHPKGDHFIVGDNAVRLGRDSALIYRHHTNWRLQAMEALDREDIDDLHYSGVISLSKKDAQKFKDTFLERLKNDLKDVMVSPEEEIYCYNLDFFNLQK